MYWQMDRPDKANCTSGRQEPHGYQGLPKGSVRTGYEGNQAECDFQGQELASISFVGDQLPGCPSDSGVSRDLTLFGTPPTDHSKSSGQELRTARYWIKAIPWEDRS
jgi:hypothetical protein